MLNVSAQAQNSLRAQLRDSGDMEPHHAGNFAQVELFLVVKAQHDAFIFGHLLNAGSDDALQLRLLQNMLG